MPRKSTKKVTEIENVEAKAIELRKPIFDAVNANLAPLFTDVNGNAVAKLGEIPVGLLEIDDSYQRDRHEKTIAKLINKWDFSKYDLITVVPHKETNTFSVVDGQGRTIAASTLKLGTLKAKVLMTAPSEIEERQKYEAQMFIQQDDEVLKLRNVDKHKARVLCGEKAAVDLNNVLKKYGVEYRINKGRRAISVLGSYDETYRVSKVYGLDGLEFIFSIIKNAGWLTETNGLAKNIVSSLRAIYAVYDGNGERNKINTFLGRELRSYDPNLLVSMARSTYPTRDTSTSLTLVMEDILVDAGIVERAIYIENDKVVTLNASERAEKSA